MSLSLGPVGGCDCCDNCCTLCSGKACNEGVEFGGEWSGASGPGASEANVASSGWVNPWVGARFDIETGWPAGDPASENAAAGECVYSQILDDVSYVDGTLGSVVVYFAPIVTFYVGAASGHLFATFQSDFAFPHSGGARLTGEVDLGPYEEQDCSALSVAIPLTFTPGTSDVSAYINPPDTFAVMAVHV